MRIFTMTAFIIFAFATYAAGGPKPNNKAKPDAEELLQQILQLNQDLSCERSEDCASVAMGAKSCGGPSGYLVVSKRNSNYAKIVERAKIHEAISKENLVLNAGKTMGTCNVIMPTTTVCDRKKCIEAPL